jgi:hypothetical protein
MSRVHVYESRKQTITKGNDALMKNFILVEDGRSRAGKYSPRK